MNRRYGSLILFFLLSLGWCFFLYQNLPFTFGDDLNIIRIARDTSWTMLIKAVLDPLTPAWYVHGATCQLTTRAFQTLTFKAWFILFGYSANAFYFLKALSLSAAAAAMILFFRNHWRWGIVFAVWILTHAAAFESASWIADPEVSALMFLIPSLFCVLWLEEALTQNQQFTLKKCMAWMGWIAGAWFAFKVKETARIAPFIVLAYCFLAHRSGFWNWLTKKRGWVIVIPAFLLLLTIIPLCGTPARQFDQRSGGAIFNLRWDNLVLTLQRLWHFSYSVIAVTLISLAVFLTNYFSKKRSVQFNRLFMLSLPWFVFVLAGYLMNFNIEHNDRYLVTLLCPLALLTWSMLSQLEFRKTVWGMILLIGLLGYAIQLNISDTVFGRIYHQGFPIADSKLTRAVYTDRFGAPEPTWAQLADFYWGVPPAHPSEFTAIRIKDWDKNFKEKKFGADVREIRKKWGSAYRFSFDSDVNQRYPEFNLVYTGTTSVGSAFDKLIGKIKKKAVRKIYLYRCGAAAPASSPV